MNCALIHFYAQQQQQQYVEGSEIVHSWQFFRIQRLSVFTFERPT